MRLIDLEKYEPQQGVVRAFLMQIAMRTTIGGEIFTFQATEENITRIRKQLDIAEGSSEDRLRSEYQRRRGDAQRLPQNISEMQRELQEMDDEYNGPNVHLDSYHGEMPQMIWLEEIKLKELEEEMRDINQVLNEKW